MSANSAEVLAIVLGGGRGERLFPLTKLRSKPAVPLAGKYRIVDIPLSNCINSDIRKVFVLTQFNSASLNRHIAQTYRFDKFSDGFVNILAAEQTPENPHWFQGTADAVRQSIRHFADIDVSLVLILSGDQLYLMDYRNILKFHLHSKADITVSTIPVPAGQASGFGIMKVDENNQIQLFREKPAANELGNLDSKLAGDFDVEQFPKGNAYLASMGIYVFSKKLLMKILASTSEHDFGKNIIPDSIGQYRVMSYPFFDYWTDIGTIRSFYEANLDLTANLPKFNFYNASSPIYTRARLLPGSKMDKCNLHKCLISEGSILSGSDIEHSIVGIRSRVGYGTTISNSYIMGADFYESLDEIRENARHGIPNIGIGNHATIVNAIIDKNARIGDNVVITNSRNLTDHDDNNFCVRDKIVVVPKGAIVPDGTVI
ncbi:MAG: glucose-1-phosphate adenylyltransferase [Acidobacteria bacterium]|nr:MAG: glucose-1-phosphate adenylyltransferase [Acidobacteriota bacterium]